MFFSRTFPVMVSLLVAITPLVTNANDRPNIILITADDMGFDDLSMNKHPHVQTPNLDAIAQQSVQFDDFTVTPVCSTTRAALLTGRDFYKTGVSGVHGGRDFMHLSETLLSEVLQQNGYATGTWGKWHLGKTEGYYPWDRGFDQGYYAELYRHQDSNGYLNGQAVQHDKWVSEVVTDYAIDFIDNNKAKPFFAYLSYLAPHEPWLAPEQFAQPLIDKGLRPAIAHLYGMVNEMDFHIGRLMAHLKNEKLLDNTIVIFLSDNGPWWDSSNFGAMTKKEWQERNPSKMNGNKGQSWQNGIRSPLFIHWPQQWQPATVSRYVDVKDIFPTLVEVTGSSLLPDHKPVDGISFLSYLEGNTSGVNNRETYIGSHDVISAKTNFNQWTPIDKTARNKMNYKDQLIGLRTEKYKLLLNSSNDKEGLPLAVNRYALFDMQKDPLEKRNLYNELPHIANSLAVKLKNKFTELKDSPEAYRPPVYLIKADEVSVVNGFGPAKTTGNTYSNAHQLTNMKESGDSALYQLNVEQAGSYRIYIKQSNHNSVGMEVSLSTGTQKLRYEFTEAPTQYLGELNLPEGLTELELAVVANNSIKHWSAINGLRRIFFVPSKNPVDPNSLPVPN